MNREALAREIVGINLVPKNLETDLWRRVAYLERQGCSVRASHLKAVCGLDYSQLVATSYDQYS